MTTTLRLRVPPPIIRRLRVFAIDPGMTARFETAVLNEMTLEIPWEELSAGPVGEYLAVVDEDNTGRRLHDPVDLDRQDILAQDGLPPSDGNPQFRQQMVYAVAMRTLRNFERALGRVVHWAPREAQPHAPGSRKHGAPTYERRLRLYPHYYQTDNAHLEYEKGLCFGYFLSPRNSPLPDTAVYTCLSQDVIAHELTHALLRGMRISFEGRHPDVEAFHEAFSDLVALLQHFWPSDVLRQQLGAIRGHLEERSALGAVALQFGQAIGRPDGIRNALGYTDKAGQWHPRRPDPAAYAKVKEPHDRGDILVAAVFEAFRKIFESRVADLRRIASKGTGILAEGSLHPDLVNRFAIEASRSAQRVLELCLRAVDYLPPVEVAFGDFLRAVVTADFDIAPVDECNYRLAFVDAFRQHGILPTGVATLSQDSLLWPDAGSSGEAEVVASFIRDLSKQCTPWSLPQDRESLWHLLEAKRDALKQWIVAQKRQRLGPIDLSKPFEVQSFHPRERSTLSGELSFQWVIKLVQQTSSASRPRRDGPPLLCGMTLIIDGDSGRVRYKIEAVSPKARAANHVQLVGMPGRTRLPTARKLRVFAFDPSFGIQFETAKINEVTITVPWERDAAGVDLLQPGPVGEYLEVVDRDPASGCFYDPVDLNDPFILAQDGLPPSESNPQFHQQMVYAVAMRTIRSFEQALGRLALWWPRRDRSRRPGRANRTSSGCASIRTRCARPTPTTARRRRRCCSATSRRRSSTTAAPRRA